MDSIAVYDEKPRQLPIWGVPSPPEQPRFNLELEHVVWLAKFGHSQNKGADLASIDWDGYQPELGLPDLWQRSVFATSGFFGGSWQLGALRGAMPRSAAESGPMPGDRVVVYRQSPHMDVLGVVLVTAVAYGRDGGTRCSYRPLVSCLAPVPLKPALRLDADLAEAWGAYFGSASRSRGAFAPLDGVALSAVMRTVGIDPGLLCGPVEDLPDCSMSNLSPGMSYRPATHLHTHQSEASIADRRATSEAIDWLLTGTATASTPGPTIDVETVASGGAGVCLVARSADAVRDVVALGVVGNNVDDIELCPTTVLEAVSAAEEGRAWHLMVTLDVFGTPRTLRFSADAVAVCFDPRSGRVATMEGRDS